MKHIQTQPQMNQQETDSWLRTQAYFNWLNNGQVSGYDEVYWQQARAQLLDRHTITPCPNGQRLFQDGVSV